MTNIYCEICKRFHNKKKLHTSVEKDINSRDVFKMIEIISKVLR